MEDIRIILCVDDDELSLHLMREYVNMLVGQYVSAESKNGKDCLEFVSQHYVDLIILDHSLGDMDGINVCKNISSVSRNPNVPIIIVSMVDSEDLNILYEDNNNIVKISQKPYAFEQFKQEVEDVFLNN